MLQQLTAELYNSYDKQDYEKCEILIVPIKVELVKYNLLVPLPSNTQTDDQINDLKISQKILEIGALSSLLLHNYDKFENCYSQLKPFYSHPKIHLKKEHNTNSTKIISLNLIYLLSQGLVSKYHIELESLSYYRQFDVTTDKYLQFPINIERNLMEGNYIKIWKLLHDETNLPCGEYSIFLPTLMNALRYQIAKSLEKSYTSIPISNCKSLLYISQQENYATFQKILAEDLQLDWNIKNDIIYFDQDQDMEIDNSNKLINNVLNYADQIESII